MSNYNTLDVVTNSDLFREIISWMPGISTINKYNDEMVKEDKEYIKEITMQKINHIVDIGGLNVDDLMNLSRDNSSFWDHHRFVWILNRLCPSYSLLQWIDISIFNLGVKPDNLIIIKRGILANTIIHQ